MPRTLDAFISKWAASGAAERANKDSFLNELCDVLEVARPNPTVNDLERDSYVFERKVPRVHDDGETTSGSIDLYKQDCFILEAKQASGEGASRLGKAKRDTPAWNILMKDAYGQALGYARGFDRPPPFIIVCDIGYCLDLYAAFDGSGDYRAFPNAQKNRMFIAKLAEHRVTLRAIFENPLSLDPSKHAARVTREVAGHLASLAKTLEDAGHDQALVAQFLMRCLFTMFAEDVGLLPEGVFTRELKEHWLASPDSFPGGVQSLWRTMNEGGEMFGVVGKILRFNGGLFANSKALKLDKKALELLLEAGKCDWSDVEPAIFGTLLERALDPKERHALGAHYTPRAYVERLVRPTIEEPLRADWDVVQAQVRRLVVAAEEAKTPKAHKDKLQEAKAAVRDFHLKLCKTRVLDPACGSGNFLYVTLDLFKRLEGEVLALLESLGEKQTLMHMESVRVTPAQFHGIEVKRWAKEIAELVLWIGYLQWHFRIHGKAIRPDEPILRDYKNIECRDAVLAWDGEPELVRDEKGKPVTRWDGETMKLNPVTGESVPDESARVEVYRYKNPRKAEWPEADFIVGNPPFIGNKRMRLVLGDGYVEALRIAHEEMPETADFVMYWWNMAAHRVRAQGVRRFGLITTNSITQQQQRQTVESHLTANPPVHLVFAVPDHPWTDSATAASVRIAMSACEKGLGSGTLASVISEQTANEDEVFVALDVHQGTIQPDFRVGANVGSVKPLTSNAGLSFMGVTLVGEGFRIERSEFPELGLKSSNLPPVVRPYRSGKELTQVAKERWVIDFFGLDEAQARNRHPTLYQRLLDLVRPTRMAKAGNNKDSAGYAAKWWLFAKPRPDMRKALSGLHRFIATIETSKHKTFLFLDARFLPDHKVYAIASEDAYVLGVLSSKAHRTWALAAGGRLGVGNDPTWTNTTCFLPFAFPDARADLIRKIRLLAEELDAHRKRQQASHPDLTITGMYNVLEKLRSGEALNAKDKVIHEQGLVSVLKKLHDDLDAAVFDAYGWPHDLTDEQILEHLVALNAERAAEEQHGLVRWLRPEFQNPSGAKPATQEKLPKLAKAGKTGAPENTIDAEPASASKAACPWPKKLPDQIAAVRDLLSKGNAEWSVADVVRSFKAAKKDAVEEVLESLAALGILAAYESRAGRRWKRTRAG